MIKKLSLLFLICILSALNINAEVYEGSCGSDGDNVKYSLDTETGALKITGTGDMDYYNYSSFVPWNSKKTYIKSIEISDGVTSIGSYAFRDCTGLTSVTIGNSVTSIGYRAFSSCSDLTSITIPNSVTSIGISAFYYCSGLTSVTIPNSVTCIGDSAFYSCSGLTSVTIPNSVTSIGSRAFYGCSGLTSITIPNSVTSIRSQAFNNCSGLTSVTIGNSVTSIGYRAFSSCSDLTSITIPNSVTSIGGYAFEYCSNLTSITIPNSVTSIEYCAFYGCSGLTSVKSDISVPFTFGLNAFSGISSNCVLAVPSGTKDAYISNGWTTSVFKGGIKEFRIVVDGIYYYFNSNNKQATITAGENQYSGNVIIPSSVTFNDTEYSVTTIGESAFYGCTGLTSVYIPSSVKTIGNNAFANCTELLDVYCYARKSPAMGTNAFANSGIQFATLYVPEASLNGYKVTEPWSGFGDIKALFGEYPEVPEITKCATPTIIFENGKLSFSCETEGVRYVYNFSTPSESDEDGKGINMPNKLQVSVYAKKDGYENSDVATKEIDLGTSGIRGDLNGDGVVSMPDAMFIVNKILNGKFPDEEDNGSKPGVRFGFYETIPGYSVKIDKVNMDGVSPYVMGSNAVGTNLNTTASQPTWDKANGSYSFVDFANSNDMFVRIDYTLTADDGSGEKIVVKDAVATIPTQYIQWKSDYKYTYIIKIFKFRKFLTCQF